MGKPKAPQFKKSNIEPKTLKKGNGEFDKRINYDALNEKLRSHVLRSISGNTVKPLNAEEIWELLPRSIRNRVPRRFVEKYANTEIDENFSDIFVENFFSYMHLIGTNVRTNFKHYINAIKFVTYTNTGANKLEAYAAVFPEKYKLCMEEMPQPEGEHKFKRMVYSYATSKTVSELTQQTTVPAWLVNAPVFQLAVNESVRIMLDDETPVDIKQKAADSLMARLQQPEVLKVEHSLNQDTGSSPVDEYEKASRKLAETMRLAISEHGLDSNNIVNLSLKEKEKNVTEAELVE